jgi:DNA mismatch endonuclease (patch repair protein)
LSKLERSAHMAKIRGCGTKPERILRAMLRRMGIRFHAHDDRLPGKPDFVVPSVGAVVFAHGCFWHRHAACGASRRVPGVNTAFWCEKFRSNIARDRRVARQLRAQGWRVLVVWECAFRDLARLERRLAKALRPA